MKKILAVCLAVVMCISLLTMTIFAADTPSSWATEQVNKAIANNLVPQSLQGQYTQATTRAEFCALAVALYETATSKEIAERTKFNDTTDINVEKAAAIGVVSGVGVNKFDPNSKLTREQAAVMLSRLSHALSKPLAKQSATFADNANISSWALEAVGQIKAAGIMGGVGNNKFAPKNDYTREQSIVTILRSYDVIQGNTENTGNLLNGTYEFQGEDYATGQGTITYTFIFKSDGTVTKTYKSSNNDSSYDTQVTEKYYLEGNKIRFETNKIISSSFVYDKKTDTITLEDGRIFKKAAESTTTPTTPQPTPTDKPLPKSELSISPGVYRFDEIKLGMTVNEVKSILGDYDIIEGFYSISTEFNSYCTWIYPFTYTYYTYGLNGEVMKNTIDDTYLFPLKIEVEFYCPYDQITGEKFDELRVVRKSMRDIRQFISTPETFLISLEDFYELEKKLGNGEKITYQDATKALGCNGILVEEYYYRPYAHNNPKKDIVYQTYVFSHYSSPDGGISNSLKFKNGVMTY